MGGLQKSEPEKEEFVIDDKIQEVIDADLTKRGLPKKQRVKTGKTTNKKTTKTTN